MNLLRAARQVAGATAATLALCGPWAAQAQVAVPPLTGHVVDQSGTLTPSQQAVLEKTLTEFEAAKGSQLAVLLVPTTAPEDIAQYALRVAEQWKLGRKKVDDGAILVVAKSDRTLRIEVGYGLEGALSDVVAMRIINESIVPQFRKQDYYGGISAGVERMMGVVNGEALPAPPDRPDRSASDFRQYAPILLVVALALGGVLRAMLGRVPGAVITGGVVATVAWFMVGALTVAMLAGAAALVLSLLGVGTGLRLLGGYYGGGSGGGQGGFRGGGGGFGGGGASGRW
jgi:uncharacterized protein